MKFIVEKCDFAIITFMVVFSSRGITYAVEPSWYVHPGTSTNISYWTNTTKQDINEAHAYCTSTGGKLAWVPDAGAMEVIKQLKKNNGHEWSPEYYIGHKEINNVVYVWGTDISQSYSNWAPAQPDVEAHTCVSVYGSDGYWMDEDCTKKLMVFCSDYAPSPSTQTSATTTNLTPTSSGGTCRGLEYNATVNNRVICYWTFTTTQNIDDSESLCVNSGGYLAYIPNADALDVVQQLRVADGNAIIDDYWIGYTEVNHTVTVRNTAIIQDYVNWETYKPDDMDNTCVTIFGQDAVWFDELCSKHFMVVCSSYSPSEASETSTSTSFSSTPSPTSVSTTSPTSSTSLSETTTSTTSSYTSTYTSSYTQATFSSLDQTCPAPSPDTVDCTLSNTTCVCGCVVVNNRTEAENEAFVNNFTEEVKRELTVDKKTLSSTLRRKKSADDSRPSSAAMGALGVMVLLTVLGAIVINDVPSMVVRIKELKDHLKQYLHSRGLL